MSTIDKAMAKLKGLGAEEQLPSGNLQDEPAPQPQVEKEEKVKKAEKAEKPSEQAIDEDYSAKLVQEELPVETPAPKKPAPEPKVKTPQVAASRSSASPAAKPNETTENSFPQEETRSSKYSEINVEALTQKGFITQQSTNRHLKEQFRAVKRKLLNNAFGAISKTLTHANLIIVSSCNANEGKTFSAINLALSIALEQDKTVLLVDTDVLRPNVVKELGVPPVSGLTEFLSGQISDVSDIIYNTNIDNFKFISAGSPHELSTELLASEKMAKLMEELASRYSDRVVIFDAPPLLGVNETHIMANLVGQAVIVVEENKTRLTDVQVAVEQLEKKLAIGFLVNKSKGEAKDQYGYGYGYYRKD